MTFQKLRACAPLALCLALWQTSPLLAGEQLQRIFRVLPWSHDDVGKKPHTGKDTCVEELAKNIDWLEGQINVYGTVVAKTPDVWGEARLTSHRQEFEDVLKAELRSFNKNTINAAEFVSDQAFLQFALAMNARATGVNASNQVPFPQINMNATGTTVTTPPGANNNPTAVTITSEFTPQKLFGFAPDKLEFGKMVTLEQTEMLDQLTRYVNHLHQHRRINEGDDTSDAPGYSMNLVRIPVSVIPGQRTRDGYGAEITVTAEPYLGPELLPMAYRDLVTNDLVEQLALPITRFINSDPKRAAELMTLLNDRETVRNKIKILNASLIDLHTRELSILSEEGARLAAQKLKDRNLAFFSVSGIPTGRVPTADELTQFLREKEDLLAAAKPDPMLNNNPESIKAVKGLAKSALETTIAQHKATAPMFVRSQQGEVRGLKDSAVTDMSLKTLELARSGQEVTSSAIDDTAIEISKLYSTSPDVVVNWFSEQNNSIANVALGVNVVPADLEILTKQDVAKLQEAIPNVHLPSSTTRKATLPFPPTQLVDNYGIHELGHVVYDAYHAFQNDVLNREVVHVTDVQAFLKEEVAASFELMQTDAMRGWWELGASNPRCLYEMIRLRDLRGICEMRNRFLDDVRCKAIQPRCLLPVVECAEVEEGRLPCPEVKHNATAALAWCVYVESLLLNERLLQDMRDTFGNQPSTPQVPGWMAFFGPNPCEEARMLFAEYVRVRWPLKVFALDPVNTEQNVADIRSVYRQMQMSIALSFAQGGMSTSAALQAMRKLQRDRATIDLNRTAVGFGHGNDTFGWRFYPRFQNLPVEGNATVFLRDMVIGGPTDKQLEKSRVIEPGMRECMAIVLMPSFVPHVTFSTRSNWFKLGSNGRIAASISDTVEYSRAVKHMQTNAAACVRCAHLYRDGEVDRLLKRVHQLDRKLPLQTLECQVPIENTHGGFEIFSAGTRELTPELNGWYGAPGYDPARTTQFFLSGDNFNVTTTSLIIGNQKIPYRLLSRQIMEVTLPAGLPVIRDRKLLEAEKESYEGYLDAHIATPYGVSGHLLIPVVRAGGPTIIRPVLSSQVIRLAADVKKDGTITYKPVTPQPLTLGRIDIPPNVGLGSATTLSLFPSSGGDRLKAVNNVAIEATADRLALQVTASQTIEQLATATDGRLGFAIDHYIKYMVNTANNRPERFIIDVGAAILVNSSQVPVDGSITVEVTMRYLTE